MTTKNAKRSLITGLIALTLGTAAVTIVLVQPGHAAPQPTDEPAMAPRPLQVSGSGEGTQKTAIKVNGFNVTGIIDTGATSLALNGETFCKMAKANMITEGDLLGFSESMIADGSKVKVIVYKTRVRIAGAVLKSVITVSPVGEFPEICNDKSPNLIGKSVLSRFESVTFTKSGKVVLSDKYEMGKE